MVKNLWLATSKEGQMRVYTEPPLRNERMGVWEGHSMGCISAFISVMESEGLTLPPLRWHDEPREVRVVVEI